MATAVQNTGPAEYVDPTTGYPSPPDGLTVNQHILVEFTGKYAASNGSYAAGIALFKCLDPAETYGRYVVWTLILRPESTGKVWVCESGSYCQTIGEALAAYERRGGVV